MPLWIGFHQCPNIAVIALPVPVQLPLPKPAPAPAPYPCIPNATTTYPGWEQASQHNQQLLKPYLSSSNRHLDVLLLGDSITKFWLGTSVGKALPLIKPFWKPFVEWMIRMRMITMQQPKKSLHYPMYCRWLQCAVVVLHSTGRWIAGILECIRDLDDHWYQQFAPWL